MKFFNNFNTTQENGRSMIEMLGVLAIIGVLSISGVEGYTIAMNKYRANELLNEATARAVALSTQALMGRTGSIPVSCFGASVPGVSFDENATIENGKIKLTLTGVSPELYSQMKASLGEDGIMKISDDPDTSTLTLTFNQDLSKGVDTTTEDECHNSCDYSTQECVNKICTTKVGYCPASTIVLNEGNQWYSRKECTIDSGREGDSGICFGDGGVVPYADCHCEDGEWTCNELPL